MHAPMLDPPTRPPARIEQPVYAIVRAAGAACEVRRYEPMIVASTRYAASSSMAGDSDGTFGRLARFIGVFSTPANTDGEGQPTAISMTAPVFLSNPAPRADEDKSSHMERERMMMFTMPASRFKVRTKLISCYPGTSVLKNITFCPTTLPSRSTKSRSLQTLA